MNSGNEELGKETVQVPATEGWPVVAAFGVSLLWAGLLTHWMVSLLGALCFIAGLVNWFHEVLPRESHEPVSVLPEPVEAEVPVREVQYLQAGEQGHRARLPLEIYPYSAGVRGGLAGGAAMFVLAVIYGLVYHNSIWYPANLLAAAGSSSIAAMSYEQLRAYNGLGVVLATIIHLTGSVLVGLLYGIALPMVPRRPILFGGIIAPLLWSGLLYSAMGIINPTLAAHVDWFRFVLAQIVFGVVAGLVVVRHSRIRTLQFVPVAQRMGLEAAGISEEKGGEDSK